MSEIVAKTVADGLPSHIGPGVVVGGKYRLEEEIGRGSMGTVYRAVHVTLGQRVAIKLISSEHSQSLEARKRFSVEAKAAAKLRSRHVVQIYDDGETPEGNPYIVLEYLDGETLEQRLERDHDIPLSEAVRVTSHVGRALARAHAQGIVHRDLKPANIFLVKTEDDEVGWIAKVLDFGIAKLETPGEKGTTQAGTVLGTPLFMSPEQVRGASSVDHRADLYSLGICLFHMMTGEFAFYSPNYSDILISICTEPLPQLRSKAPWVPEAVELWFQRACAKEPLERFQSADEMTEALAAAAGTSTLSKHKSFPEGRIAPETLVGYAAPAVTMLQAPENSPASMRTLVLGQPGSAPSRATETSPGYAMPMESQGRPVVPIVIAAGDGQNASTSGAWSPPTRDFRPLVIGLLLGLLAVSAVALTVMALSSGDRDKQASPSASGPASPAAALPPRAAAPAQPTAAPPAAVEPAPAAPQAVVSSEAAPSEPAPVARKTKQKHAGKPPALAPAGPSPKPAPARPPGSDLGF